MGTGELLGKPNKLRGVTCDGLASRPGGVEIFLATSCYKNWDKLWQLRVSWLQGFTSSVSSQFVTPLIISPFLLW